MEEPIAITKLNDFIFCPASIYFHALFGEYKEVMYQSDKQLNGKEAHRTIDTGGYSTSKDILHKIIIANLCLNMYNSSRKVDIDMKKSFIFSVIDYSNILIFG